MGKVGIIIVIIVILLAGGVYFFMVNGKISTPQSKKVETTPLGEQIYTQIKNPIKGKIPETNPFKVETNPIRALYPNPFR